RLATIYGDKSDKEKLAPPASCNGGQLNIGGVYLDLGANAPRLTIVKDHKLLQNVATNEVLAQALGKFANSMFAKSNQAQGVLDVTIVECQNVALGELMRSPDSGAARVTFNLRNM